MIHSSDQLKALVRNESGGDNNKALLMIRKFMMDRFLERLSVSSFRDNFILKGGILVSSMAGIENRSTMDIDTTIQGFNLDEETVFHVINEIAGVSLEDEVTFLIKKTSSIMDDAEYPGIRIMLDAMLGRMHIPVKVDISTGDVITPSAIEYEYPLLFENRRIELLSYNLETVLAEKLETILSRGTANTRMRDYYDIALLSSPAYPKPDWVVLAEALKNTASKRNTLGLVERKDEIIAQIGADEDLRGLWNKYSENYDYARNLSWEDVLKSVVELFSNVR